MTDTLSLGFVANKKGAASTATHGFVKNVGRKPPPQPIAQAPPKRASRPSIGSLMGHRPPTAEPRVDNIANRNAEYTETNLKQHRARIDALTSQVQEISEDAGDVRRAAKQDLQRVLELTNVVYGKTQVACPSALIDDESAADAVPSPEEFTDEIPAATWCLLVYPMVSTRSGGVAMKSKMVDSRTGQLYWAWVSVSEGETRYFEKFSMVPSE